jgi:hypothetical protein
VYEAVGGGSEVTSRAAVSHAATTIAKELELNFVDAHVKSAWVTRFVAQYALALAEERPHATAATQSPHLQHLRPNLQHPQHSSASLELQVEVEEWADACVVHVVLPDSACIEPTGAAPGTLFTSLYFMSCPTAPASSLQMLLQVLSLLHFTSCHA